MRAFYLKNFRKGLATNSSSTHSVIYRNKGELFEDLNIFDLNYYGRCDSTIAASKSAKIKYVLANIMWDEELVRIMSDRYPEMKKYFPLIKDAMKKDEDGYYYNDDEFGMYCRGSLSVFKNIPFSVDYLTNIIEDEDIIIVGGSDEGDFVYDTIEDHKELPDPDSDYDAKYHNKGIVKNGNYWVGFGNTHDRIFVKGNKYGDYPDKYKYSFGGRLRFSVSKDAPIPEYPELIDLRITNKCDHGCKFCFMNSNMTEKNADLSVIQCMLSQLNGRMVEFSIGGGNILLYPDLKDLFIMIKEAGHIINVTINVKDCDTILENKLFTDIFREYVDGIGISVFSVDDVKKACWFRTQLMDENEVPRWKVNRWSYQKYFTLHTIPEYLGYDKTKKILDEIEKDNIYFPVLFLGYKTNGRGETQEYHVFTNDELSTLCKDCYNLSCDTTFANRYMDWLKDNYTCDATITWNEGEYSMYIDAVSGNAYKSSYQLDKPYPIYYTAAKEDPETGDREYYNVITAFGKIRQDGGFPVYDEENAKHYWDGEDGKHYWE